jgi:hypothetical protein
LDYLLKWVLKKKRNSFFFVPKLLKLGGSHWRVFSSRSLEVFVYLRVFPSNLVPILEGWWSLIEQLLVPLTWHLMWLDPTLLNQSSSLWDISIVNLFLSFRLSRQWLLLHQHLQETWFHIHLWRLEALMTILKTLQSWGFKVYETWKMQIKHLQTLFYFYWISIDYKCVIIFWFDLMHQIWNFVVIWFMVVHNNRCRHNMVMHNIILNFFNNKSNVKYVIQGFFGKLSIN